ncbi:MAG: DUF1059 domain-containing protein [Thaumarchaeota archaeon]|jgi:predicted small metal-binding protein|nr:DUF1059 domain-containing protein [Nitrososphaerota archaeon]MBT5842554.1 DUF1059 domain-containing protein [Nitrososphaerota archaeon]MBT6469364.1 DUF1059 domain-containing protein [Nitrososphaerota archaeon]
MVNIRCEDYGFDCDYSLDGDVDSVVYGYQSHMTDEHGIDYSSETLCKTVMKKLPKQVHTNI